MSLSPCSALCCEVLDNNNKPLCIMPLHSVVAQKLRYKLVVALATDGERYLLSASDRIDVTAVGSLPPAKGCDEYAEELLLAATGYPPRLKFVARPDSCSCLPGALLHIFHGHYSPAMLASLQSPQLVIVPRADLAGQKDFLSPLLLTIMDF